MRPLLLDTDILSHLMRRQSDVVRHATSYVEEHGHFTLSIVTRFEILRGLAARSATRQRRAFDKLCAASHVLDIDEDVVVRAAAIYANLYRRGALIGDADILIAATALVNGLGVCTNNTRHFARITDLDVVNWLDI